MEYTREKAERTYIGILKTLRAEEVAWENFAKRGIVNGRYGENMDPATAMMFYETKRANLEGQLEVLQKVFSFTKRDRNRLYKTAEKLEKMARA